MADYTLFALSDGEILSNLSGDLFDEDIPVGSDFIAGWYDTDAYSIDLLSSVPTLKTLINYTVSATTITADGVDEIIVSGLPAGTVCKILGNEEAETNNEIKFSVDLACTYTLMLSHNLYIDTAIEIIAI